MKERPFTFGWYIVLSSVTLFYSRQNPENFWIYLIYCACVCFRNLFLIPFLGYSLLITFNNKKRELLSDQDKKNLFQGVAPMFSNTPLVHNGSFLFNFSYWTTRVAQLKPTQVSLRKTSLITAPSLTMIILNFRSLEFCQLEFESFVEKQLLIDKQLDLILNDKTDLVGDMALVKKMAEILEHDKDSLSKRMGGELNHKFLGLYFFFNQTPFREISSESTMLAMTSTLLRFCYESQLGDLDSKNTFSILKKLINFEDVS